MHMGENLLVDADTHLDVDLREIAPFSEAPWRSTLEVAPPRNVLPQVLGDSSVKGRILHPASQEDPAAAPQLNADVRIVFPGDLSQMTLHPNPQFQTAVAGAYDRWLTEAYLPAHPDARGMLYVPFLDPDAAVQVIEAFGDRPGVAGAFVTTAGLPRLHENRYLPIYRALEDRGLALGFHPLAQWHEPPLEVFDHYLPVWAYGQPFTQSVLLTNWVLHAMSDRFPKLNCGFYECGLCWLAFISHRLDAEFLKRPSEAPLLRERPSHYVRRCFFSTQPVDQVEEPEFLTLPINQVGTSQLLYSSNLPRWDFDTPDAVRHLSFLSEPDRQAILGGNARRVFLSKG